MTEDAAGSPFGLKLASVNSSLTGATVTPAGPPQSISVDLGATNPNAGDTITFTFTLPDGTTQTLQLQATSSASPGPNQFVIGATSDVTAANLQAALAAGVTQIGQTTLPSASAVAASNNFFDHPPMRVSGSPATATALVAGTSANTVSWYTGGTTAATLTAAGGAAITAGTAGTFDITSAGVNSGNPVAVTVANGNSLATVVTKINTALGAGSDVQASLNGGQIVLTSASGNNITVADAVGNLAGTTAALGFTNATFSMAVRSTATARIDPSTTISYGTQANEQGIRWIVQNVATLAATTYSASDPNASTSYATSISASIPRLRFPRYAKYHRHRGEPGQCADVLMAVHAKPAPADLERADQHVAVDRGRRSEYKLARKFYRMQTQPVGIAVDNRKDVAAQSASLISRR